MNRDRDPEMELKGGENSECRLERGKRIHCAEFAQWDSFAVRRVPILADAVNMPMRMSAVATKTVSTVVRISGGFRPAFESPGSYQRISRDDVADSADHMSPGLRLSQTRT